MMVKNGGGIAAFMCVSISLSKHFIIIGFKAIGLYSFKHFAVDFFGTGIIGVDLKQVGTIACRSELLNILVNMC